MSSVILVSDEATATLCFANCFESLNVLELFPVNIGTDVTNSWTRHFSKELPLIFLSRPLLLAWQLGRNNLLRCFLHNHTIRSERYEVVLSTTVANLSRGPSDPHPVPWPLHVANWCSFRYLYAMVVEAVCKSTISICNTSRTTCLDVEVLAHVSIPVISILHFTTASASTCCKSRHTRHIDSAAVENCKDFCIGKCVLHEVS